MGSSRLPGKVLRDLGGRPVLDWVIRAARSSDALHEVIVATSLEGADDSIQQWAERAGVPVVRGSSVDVLSRFLVCLDRHPADAVVRLTGDCPLLDPRLITRVVRTWKQNADLDYLSTVTPRSLPRGLDVELASASALRRVDRHAIGVDRVHVTSAIYGAPDVYSIAGLVFAPPATDLRVTMDTEEDAALLAALIEMLGDRPPAWRDVVAVLRQRPDISAINASVRQKQLEDG
jgi:spore coat polysaccharide biosynthesis protein SpsF